MIAAAEGLAAEGRDELEQAIRDEEDTIERLVTAIAQGVSTEIATRQTLEHEFKLAELKNKLVRYPVPETEAKARARIELAIQRMESSLGSKEAADWIHRCLRTIVETIVMKPIDGRKHGETIDISIRNQGWPDFYKEIMKP